MSLTGELKLERASDLQIFQFARWKLYCRTILWYVNYNK